MHIGKSYRLFEFLHWTRRKLYVLMLLSAAPVLLYQVAGLKMVAIPWAVVALLGTATSFIVGFKNAQTYNRTLEAQQVWASIAASSRYWGLIAREFPSGLASTRELIYRHLAWLTALRYQLRSKRVWETAASMSNEEYRANSFQVPEREIVLATALQEWLPAEIIAQLGLSRNKATCVLALQSAALKTMAAGQEIGVPHYIEMQKTLKDFIDQQARVERIKNFPYPRQYAVINTIFVWSFALLLPFGIVREFDRLNDTAAGLLAGNMAWLAIPFSMLVSWMYISLDQVGESTENPFEGGANDVPITQTCRLLEIEMREMLGESDRPRMLQPKNNIIL